MIAWSKLPNEILLNIFQRNDDNTNSQCSLTCRDWKYTAQCALFEKISNFSYKDLDLIPKVFSVYQSDCTNFGQSPGNYVKILDCHGIDGLVDWESLDRLFPFLEIIETDEYNEKAYNDIYILLKEGKFSYLKVLPTNDRNKPPLELLLDHREKIEELKLYPTSLKDEMLRNMHLFPNIKMLYLNYPEEVHLEHFFSEEYLHLKSINITFGYNYRNLNTSLLDLNNIHPFKNIREMKIEYHQFYYDDDKYLLYIMKKFPNLDSLELADDRQCFPDFHNSFANFNYEVPTISCLFQFLIYLFKMKYCYVVCMMTDNFTTQIVKNFLGYVNDQESVHSKNIELSLHVKFHIVKPEQAPNYHPDRNIYIGLKNQKAGYKDYKEDECILSVVYKVMQETVFQSYLQLFQEVGDKDITSLVLKCEKVRQSNIPIVLDKVFSHFPKLRDLSFSGLTNFTWNKEECLVEETLKSTITYMQYMRCALSEDMFPMISKRCPNLKTLHLYHCRYIKNNEDQVISRYFPIFMTSTCLEELIISLDNTIEDFQYKKAFIRLKTNNKKTRYCKIVTETGSPIVNFSEKDCTEAHYNICLHDEECGIFDIHCEAVGKLTVDFETDDCGIIDEYYSDREEDEDEEECVYWKEKEYIEEDL